MQKHEREALDAILDVARRYGVRTEPFRRGKHPEKVVLTLGGQRATIGLPSSPRDSAWAVRVARRQAEKACKAMRDAKNEF